MTFLPTIPATSPSSPACISSNNPPAGIRESFSPSLSPSKTPPSSTQSSSSSLPAFRKHIAEYLNMLCCSSQLLVSLKHFIFLLAVAFYFLFLASALADISASFCSLSSLRQTTSCWVIILALVGWRQSLADAVDRSLAWERRSLSISPSSSLSAIAPSTYLPSCPILRFSIRVEGVSHFSRCIAVDCRWLMALKFCGVTPGDVFPEPVQVVIGDTWLKTSWGL